MHSCRNCGPMSEDQFYRRSASAGGGLMTECKACFNARPRNRVRERNSLRSWRARHPGAANRQAARYRAAHRLERRALNHQRRSLNRQLLPDDLAYMVVLYADPCGYCGAPAEHIDHITPLVIDPDPHWDNLTAACRYCNQSKGDKPLLQFLLDR